MEHLFNLLPKLAHWGIWLYWLAFGISFVDSLAFIGMIMPGTTVNIFGGFLAAQRILDLGDIIFYFIFGSIIGDSLSFWLGRRGKSLFSEKNRIFHTKHLIRGEEFFAKHGEKSVILARFFGPMRHVVPFIAGLLRMPLGRFVFFDLLGITANTLLYVLLGYFLGHAWRSLVAWQHRIELGTLIIIGLLIGSWLVHRYFFHRRNKNGQNKRDIIQ